jgi:aminopeptidase N
MTMRAEWMLLLLMSAAGAAHASTTRGFDVLHYDVALIPDIAGKQVAGTQTIQLRSESPALTGIGADHALVYDSWNAPTADDRAVVYQKGAYVLHLLRAELGEEVFWRGVRDYTRHHDGQSVVTTDFQRAMEKSAGRSLQPFFAQWVYSATP